MILAIFLILVTAGLVIATHEFVDSSMRSNQPPEESEYYKVNVKPQLELVKELTKEKKP